MKKVIRDPIYSFVELEDFAIQLIDTPQFERLRYLQELGTCSGIYPSTTHTRFEHCVGVYHLTKLAIEKLLSQLMNCEIISSKVQKIVKTAGLLHDIGHGPFSHLFEYIIEEKELLNCQNHEEIGEEIIRQMMKTTKNAEQSLADKLGFDDGDIDSICDLINGRVPREEVFEKCIFLSQIVSNSINGIDTDKLDYLTRDSYAVGFGLTIDPERIFNNIGIFKYPENENGKYYISHDIKTKVDVMMIYQARYRLTKQIYYHPKTIGLNILVENIIKEAIDENIIDITSMYEAAMIPDDRILAIIQDRVLSRKAQHGALEQSLRAFNSHNIPKLVFNSSFTGGSELTENTPRATRIKAVEERLVELSGISNEYFYVYISDINYGVKEQNPLEFIPLHSKSKVLIPSEFCANKDEPRSETSQASETQYNIEPLVEKEVNIENQGFDMLIPFRFRETELFVFLNENTKEEEIESLKTALEEAIAQYLSEIHELNGVNLLILDETQDGLGRKTDTLSPVDIKPPFKEDEI